MLKRKKMPYGSSVVEIIFGILTAVIIVGIYLIYDGVKKYKRIKINNNAIEDAVIRRGNNEVIIYTIDPYDNYKVTLKDCISIETDKKTGMTTIRFICGEDIVHGCVGFVENAEVMRFAYAINYEK